MAFSTGKPEVVYCHVIRRLARFGLAVHDVSTN